MDDQSDKTTKICHFSDLHLPLTNRIQVHRLLSKRILGFANLKFRRGKTHQLQPFEALLKQIITENAQQTIITGDISNLALEFEYKEASNLLTSCGFTPENLMLIPGNHDRYTPGAQLFETFEKNLSKWLPNNFSRKTGYPLSKTVGNVFIGAMDSAIWRGPSRAAGRVHLKQLSRLVEYLEYAEVNNLKPVVAIHHPPFRLTDSLLKHHLTGLQGYEKLQDALRGRNVTVLHGHIHKQSRKKIDDIDIIGVPSASNNTGNPNTQLAYHVYTFGKSGLQKAEAVHCLPNETNGYRFERSELPDTIE